MKRLLLLVPMVAALAAAASFTLLPLAAQTRATATNVPSSACNIVLTWQHLSPSRAVVLHLELELKLPHI